MADNKTPTLARIILNHRGTNPKKALVVGCGEGIEAAILSREFDAEVTGIDITSDRFDRDASRAAHLEVGDATSLRFPDSSFDLVYSYHALEHIADYRKALQEMHRVLEPFGSWCVGTPNRSRLIGYIGSKHLSFREKLAWNANDWRMRLSGRFKNEFGAHAGFRADELSADLDAVFGNPVDITLEYYRGIYSRHRRKIDLVAKSGAARYLFPSVYFIGKKE